MKASLPLQASVRVLEARERLAASSVSGPDLPVSAGERLVGIVPVERLLAAGDDALLESIMDRPVAVASPDDDQERVALQAARSRARSVAVIDESGRFLHRVAPESVIAVLSEEHGRDPAFGSGPLATVVQDLLSIAAYFAIATALL